jgi:HK97 family phage prohead protease
MAKREQEIRTLATREFRVATSEDGTRTLSGIIPYNSLSVDLGGFTELIAPGAFAGVLGPDADILCLRDHKPELLMGRTKSKTLSLSDSVDGLRFTCKLPKTTQASDLAESVDRGDLDATSFGFYTLDDKWAADAAGNVVPIRLQLAQTSMRIWHNRSDGMGTIDQQGALPTVFTAGGEQLLTSTIFVKYHYRNIPGQNDLHTLLQIIVSALPNGFLQARYNPSPSIHIWNVGPQAPTLGEDFRARLSFARLSARCPWRRQVIPMAPAAFVWNDGAWIPPPQEDAGIVAEEVALEQVDEAANAEEIQGDEEVE